MLKLFKPWYILCFLTGLTAITSNAQNAIDLDGVDDYIQTTYTGIQGNSARTIEAWVRTTANCNPNNGGVQQIITDWGTFINGQRFTFNILWNDAIRAEIGGSGVSGTIPVNDGNWHHVAVVYDPVSANTVSLYVDGILDIAGNFTVGVNTTNTVPMRIGRRVDAARNFEGSIDEVRVWDVALSQAQLQASMNNEVCTQQSALKAYYNLNHGTASGNNAGVTTATDFSGSSNDGTLSGFALTGSTSNWVSGPTLTPGMSVTNESASGCGSYTWPANNMTYSSTGNYATTLMSSNGCDSIVNLNLFISAPLNAVQNINACDSFFWIVTGQTYSIAGTYSDSNLNVYGCDSNYTINLVINLTTSSSQSIDACDIYVWAANGQTYDTTGTYTAVLSSIGGCDSTVTLNLTVNSVDASVTDNGNGTFTANTAGATYTWLDCDNGFTAVPGATSQTFQPTANGNYALLLSNGTCSDTSACFNMTGIGISEYDTNQFQLFPNPSTGWFQVQFSQPSTGMLRVLDSNGRLIEELTVRSQTILELDLNDKAKGIYWLEYRSPTQVSTQKLVLN